MLSLRNIEKSFGDVIAVAKVNIEVPAGKSLALIRAGGSGKSALLRWMLGLERPDRGEIHFDGQSRSDATVERCDNRLAM